MRRINYDLAKVTISVFIEQRDISFQNDISLKTMRLGALSLSWEKFEKNHETHCRIVSLDQLGSQRAIILLIFSSLSSGRVKTLLKFINFCLKVDHSANLKYSKSTWRQLVVLWKVQHHNIKSYGPNACSAGLDRGTGMIDLWQLLFDVGCFRVEATNYEDVHTWVMHLYNIVPTITCSFTTRNPQVKKKRVPLHHSWWYVIFAKSH